MPNLNNFVRLIFLSLLCCLMTITTESVSKSSTVNPPVVKSGYYPPSDEFPPSAINTSFFTHVYYAFLVPSNVTFKFELSNETALLLSNFTSALRHKTPPVKTMLSIGGGGEKEVARIFAIMASNASTRSNFIDSAIEVARTFGFDGLDLDWEYPESPTEMKALGYLLKQWRREIKKEAQATNSQPLLLTAAVYFSAEFFLDENAVIRSYPIKYMEKYLDWTNVMCFDYHGAWRNITGPNAALFDPNSNVNSIYGLRSWINGGMTPKKLVMGLPLYGRTWELKDPKDNGIRSIAIGPGPGGGALGFSELEVLNNESSATVVYDADTATVYSFNGSTWIAFDDAYTTTTKIGFAQALGLRGYFFWAIPHDSNWKISAQASKSWIL